MEPLECISFLLVQDGKILAEKRKRTKKVAPDAVTLPGGHVDIGEHLEEALRRELWEELEVFPKRVKYVCTLLHQAQEFRRVTYFAVEEWIGTIRNNEAEFLLWIPWDEQERFDLTVDRVAISEYLQVYQVSSHSSQSHWACAY
jgi:8-oxo-dGTP pyrophosphatase MutT (NUDIX family)